MAIFHLNAKVISRGKGQSAIAAAAYRSGERLQDEQTAEQKFYQTRAERIQFTDIMAPKDAPEWAHDRNVLWNHAERAEKRKDGQLAREIEVSLPHELTDRQREWLVKDFAREAFLRKGYAVDIAIHAPDKDRDKRNHHAHLMVTMRTLGPDGFAIKKDPAMNRREQLGEWREQFAHLTNRHLERHGHDIRVDHRSLEAQGLDREPTKHLGYAALEMTARGAQSDRWEQQQGVLERNGLRNELKAIAIDLRALQEEHAKELQRQTGRAGARSGGSRKRVPEEPLKEQTPTSGAEADWTDRGGMAAQQAAALKAFLSGVGILPPGMPSPEGSQSLRAAAPKPDLEIVARAALTPAAPKPIVPAPRPHISAPQEQVPPAANMASRRSARLEAILSRADDFRPKGTTAGQETGPVQKPRTERALAQKGPSDPPPPQPGPLPASRVESILSSTPTSRTADKLPRSEPLQAPEAGTRHVEEKSGAAVRPRVLGPQQTPPPKADGPVSPPASTRRGPSRLDGILSRAARNRPERGEPDPTSDPTPGRHPDRGKGGQSR